MKLTPLGARALIRMIKPEETSKGGIFIPDTAKERPQEGIVVSVGEGSRPESFCRVCRRALDLNDLASTPMPVRVGDHVLVSKYAGIEMELGEDKVKHLFISEDEILGVLK